MLPPATIAEIKAEIARLEEAHERCTDLGIQRVIDGWIAELKKQLAEGTKKDS